jgi:hypothetical protein
MGETLNQRRRVQEEGLRVVNCFYGGRKRASLSFSTKFLNPNIVNYEVITMIMIRNPKQIQMTKIQNSKQL